MLYEYAERERIERTGEDGTDIIHLRAPEGKEVLIPDTGETTEAVFTRLVDGVKLGLGYIGSRNISELRQKAEWVQNG